MENYENIKCPICGSEKIFQNVSIGAWQSTLDNQIIECDVDQRVMDRGYETHRCEDCANEFLVEGTSF